MRTNDIFTTTYSPGSDPLRSLTPPLGTDPSRSSFYLPLVVPFTGWSYNLDYFNWAESWADRLGEDRISFPEEWLLE